MNEPTVYATDTNGVIRFVDGAWETFARSNGGEAVMAERVIGRRLLDFISDPTSRELYERMMTRAMHGFPVVVRFRCDAPDRRRWMRLRMTALESGLRFEVETEREEVRDPVALIDRDREIGEGLLNMCSWCNKVAVGSHWLEVEEAIEALDLFELPELPAISHGICLSCFNQLQQDVA